jgi:hypothetical protein
MGPRRLENPDIRILQALAAAGDPLAGQDAASFEASLSAAGLGTSSAFQRRFKALRNKTDETLAVELSSQLPLMLHAAGQQSATVLKRKPSSSASSSVSSSADIGASTTSSSRSRVVAAKAADYRIWQHTMCNCTKNMEVVASYSLLPEQSVMDQFSSPAAGRHALLVGQQQAVVTEVLWPRYCVHTHKHHG